MALIKCHECNHEVSTLAASCPNCGAPVVFRGNQEPKTISAPKGETQGDGLRKCPYCYHLNIETNEACSRCFRSLEGKDNESSNVGKGNESPSRSNNDFIDTFKKMTDMQKYALLFAIIIVSTVAVLIIFGEPAKSPQGTKNESTVASPSENPTPEISSKEHLTEAAKALATNDFESGIKHLEAINEGDKEYVKAQKLLRVAKQEKGKLDRQAEAMARTLVAQQLEQGFLSQGLDVSVRAVGKNNTTLKCKYILFSRPMVYNIINESTFSSLVASSGFKKLVFTDGEGNTWTSTAN